MPRWSHNNTVTLGFSDNVLGFLTVAVGYLNFNAILFTTLFVCCFREAMLSLAVEFMRPEYISISLILVSLSCFFLLLGIHQWTIMTMTMKARIFT